MFGDTNVTYDALKQRIASVNIFFNEMSETESSEDSKMSVSDLFSNIGGILGLFLGLFEKKLKKC